jgi:hypothetical protein
MSMLHGTDRFSAPFVLQRELEFYGEISWINDSFWSDEQSAHKYVKTIKSFIDPVDRKYQWRVIAAN